MSKNESDPAALGEVLATPGTAEYVVQMADSIDEINEAGDTASRAIWKDIAAVSVPAKSKRKTIIALALVEAGIKPEVGAEPLKLRALDARSAHVTVVVAKAVDPQLEMS